MDPVRPKLPIETIQLYNSFIHGDISRREFNEGVQKFATGGLAAAAIIEALMPNYAQGQQVSKTDDRLKCTYETVPSPQGNGSNQGISGKACERRHAGCRTREIAGDSCGP